MSSCTPLVAAKQAWKRVSRNRSNSSSSSCCRAPPAAAAPSLSNPHRGVPPLLFGGLAETTRQQHSSPSPPPPSSSSSSSSERAHDGHRYHMQQQQQQRLRLADPHYSPLLLLLGRRHFSSQASSAAAEPTLAPADEAEPVVRGVVVVSKEDVRKEEVNRKRLSEVLISEVLKAKHSHRWVEPVVSKHATIKEAIMATIEGGLSGMMVLDADDDSTSAGAGGDRAAAAPSRRVVGLLTSRDLLRIMALGIKEGESNDAILSRVVGDYMTPISQVIYGRPEETVGMCRTIMAKLGIKCLPILSRDGRVEGLITARDMSDFGLTAKDKGGKQAYLNDVSQRVGLSSNTSMAEPPQYLRAQMALEQSPLFVNVGRAALPHPFKTAQGTAGRSQRDIGQSEYASDPRLSEDAHFVARVRFPDETNSTSRSFSYVGVADGVGSWREYGVDPREFSHKLMQECENILREACHDNGATALEGRKFRNVISPAMLMAQAYERVKAENIIGSTTACIALFDGLRHQLHFSNLGDSGLIVLRHIDSDVAGALRREKQTPRTERTSDLRLAFVSQQQLRSFNHPFQLGWTGDVIPEGEKSSFKAARDACTSSIHVRRGDIIIMATDGLFDNVDSEDICAICLDWEQQNGFIRSGDIVARERRWSMGNSLTNVSAECVDGLAAALCQRARENSLNTAVDSPFAILAKENDIMWSGGMPDDCTCIAIHVAGVDADDFMDRTNL